MKAPVAGLHGVREAARSGTCEISTMERIGAGEGGSPSHEFIPHTAELALRLRAGAVEDLYAEACRALGRLLVEEAGDAGPGPARTLTLAAVDAEALLVDLLNDLVYLAETERWAPREAEVVRCDPTGITLHVSGIALRHAPSRIKSATHHGLRFLLAEGSVTAEVIFDV